MVLPVARVKNEIKKALLAILYDPYTHRRLKVLQSLITRNRILVRSEYECFTYKGQFYGQQYSGAYQRPKLQPEFYAEMNQWLDEAEQLWSHEQPIVEGFIALVLNNSPSGADWLEMLPEFLHAPIKAQPMLLLIPRQMGNDDAAKFRLHYDSPIQLMKQRMAINLIHI